MTATQSRTAAGVDQLEFLMNTNDDATNRRRNPSSSRVPCTFSSLAYQTDIGIRRLGGATVEDCGDHLVVETASNRGFWWGNFILLASPPAAGEAPALRSLFTRAFPTAAHLALGVDGVDGETGDAETLAELGVEVEINHVMAVSSSASRARRRAASCCAACATTTTGSRRSSCA